MKLVISKGVVEEIVRFARVYANREPVFDDLKIRILLGDFSIVFFQPERHSHLVACYFDFSGEVCFFFEDVVLAVEEETGVQKTAPNVQQVEVDELTHNNNYIHYVLEYCETNIDIITSRPPSWFLRAVTISDAATRKNFPSLADEDLLKKQALWESWQR